MMKAEGGKAEKRADSAVLPAAYYYKEARLPLGTCDVR